MAVNKDLHMQLQAYALGCLDKQDLMNLRQHFHSGEEYQWQELGEYQNLVALLPSILNVEMPEPKLKDKVARKLYRIRDEIRAKRTNEISSIKISPEQRPSVTPPPKEEPSAPEEAELSRQFDEPDYLKPFEEEPPYEAPQYEEPVPEEPEYEQPEQEEYPEEDVRFMPSFEPEPEPGPDIPEPPKEELKKPKDNPIARTQEFEVVTPKRKTSEYFRPSHETQIRARDSRNAFEIPKPKEKPAAVEEPEEEDFYKDAPPVKFTKTEKKDSEEKAPKKKNKYYEDEKEPEKKPVIFIALGIILLLLLIGGLYTYFSISSQVETYQEQVESLKNELKNLSSGNNVTNDLQAMLASPSTMIINLSSIQTNGFGKVIINPAESTGFLQLGGMPSLPPGRTYQLWINASGSNFVSLGLFEGTQEVQYYPFSLPGLTNQSNIRIILTEEPAGGAQQPGRNVYLTGNL